MAKPDLDPVYSERFVEAAAQALRWHDTQLRKGTTIPYASHLFQVCALVLEDGGTEDEACAALLHDAVEDTEATLADVKRRFGSEVARIVEACSDADGGPAARDSGSVTPEEQPSKPPWRVRKVQHFDHLRDSARFDRSVARVMAADKVANLTNQIADHHRVGEPSWDRFKGGLAGTLWYVETAAELVIPRLGPDSPLAARLKAAVGDLRDIRDELHARFGGLDHRIAGALADAGKPELRGWDDNSVALVAYEIARRATLPTVAPGDGVAAVAGVVLTAWFDQPKEPKHAKTIDPIGKELARRLGSSPTG